jgi:hypothetical protein
MRISPWKSNNDGLDAILVWKLYLAISISRVGRVQQSKEINNETEESMIDILACKTELNLPQLALKTG